MLDELERVLTGIVREEAADRAHLSVVQASSPAPTVPGQGVVRVGLTGLEPVAGFENERSAFFGPADSPQSRRVAPLSLTCALEFRMRPADATDAAVAGARALLLEDVSLLGHRLGAEPVRDGRAFSLARPDPGFEVVAFALAAGVIASETVNGVLTGSLTFAARARIWPPGAAESEGVIRTVDPVVALLPLEVVLESPTVAAGGSTRVHLRAPTGSRQAGGAAGTRTPVALALAVASDLPLAARGSIASGVPGAEAGVRVVTAALPETVVVYQAPAGDLGAVRLEYLNVHLATPDARRGLLLASVAIRLRPEVP